MKKQTENGFFDISQSADYLRISRSSLYRLIQTGQIKTVHVLSRKQVIEKLELDQFVAKSKVKGVNNV